MVPANGSVSYTLTVPVREDATGTTIDNAVTVNGSAGSHTAHDVDTLVIFRGGFESGEDGARIAAAPAAAKAAVNGKTKGKAKK